MKIINMVNNKGGVGKTTSAVNLSAGIAAGTTFKWLLIKYVFTYRTLPVNRI